MGGSEGADLTVGTPCARATQRQNTYPVCMGVRDPMRMGYSVGVGVPRAHGVLRMFLSTPCARGQRRRAHAVVRSIPDPHHEPKSSHVKKAPLSE